LTSSGSAANNHTAALNGGARFSTDVHP